MRSESDSAKISTNAMYDILEKLNTLRNRSSTRANYYRIWKLFNKFIIQLDVIPDTLEDRAYLFLANLVRIGRQSSTIRSYHSATKAVLWEDGYKLTSDVIRLQAITRACKHVNDRMHPRLPIKLRMLEMILFETDRFFNQQYYHSIRASDVSIALSKKKMLILLYSSKTHAEEVRPQKVQISAVKVTGETKRHFCPFQLLDNYRMIRGDYTATNEQLFVLRNGEPISHNLVRAVLAQMITNINLDPKVYSFHSMQAGRSTDLYNWGFSIEQIQVIG